jgi:hypothetical protein
MKETQLDKEKQVIVPPLLPALAFPPLPALPPPRPHDSTGGSGRHQEERRRAAGRPS